MTMESSRARDEAEIRTVIEGHARALGAKDADAVLSHYAPDAVVYDLAPPLRSANALNKQGLEGWFATWQGPIRHELRDLGVMVSGDLALCYGFVRMSGTKTDGARPDLWVRETVGLRRIGGAWKIAHAHSSVPFYMDGSLRAAVDLKP
jgi:ketosteroid isomerase-like protein